MGGWGAGMQNSLVHLPATAETSAQRESEGQTDGHREHHHPDPILVHVAGNRKKHGKSVDARVFSLMAVISPT